MNASVTVIGRRIAPLERSLYRPQENPRYPADMLAANPRLRHPAVYDRGRHAALEGLPVSDNPYSGPAREVWMEGFAQGLLDFAEGASNGVAASRRA